jgi:hypothetical protein
MLASHRPLTVEMATALNVPPIPGAGNILKRYFGSSGFSVGENEALFTREGLFS